jgi:Zn-dependent protease with chaperone function/Zn-finger nucleic acid-binding protein
VSAVSPSPVRGTATKTVFEIEREARWRKWLMFGLLVGFLFVVVYGLVMFFYLVVAVNIPGREPAGAAFFTSLALKVLAVSVVFAVVYWFISRIGAKERLRRAMAARPLDPSDRFHQRLANVVEELRLATGDRRIECVVVPTVGMNAFAFSDLHSTFVVGVTEGALSRLSRQQLQAVVAHEFAHVLSGDCDTATMSCLLFGIYSTLSDNLLRVMAGGMQSQPLITAGAGVLWAGLGVLRVAAAMTNAAVSRQRELAADLAAVRFTRDPLSLAQALQMMRRHPGGSGYIPSGLSPLCIRPTMLQSGSSITRLTMAHPPVELRIVRLLALAHVEYDDFEKQAAQAEEYFEGREHVEAVPGPTRLGTGAAGAATVAAGAATVAAGAGTWVPRTTPTAVRDESGMSCPNCRDHLVAMDYEGVSLHSCPSCAGRLVGSEAVQRIATRREMRFTEAQERLADLIDEQGDLLRRRAVLARGSVQTGLIACPRCGSPMLRGHYTYQYAVEVDRCVACDLIWFETDELEALQILVERLTG